MSERIDINEYRWAVNSYKKIMRISGKDWISVEKYFEKRKITTKKLIMVLIYKFSSPGMKKKIVSIPDNLLLVDPVDPDNHLGKILTALSYILKYGDCEKMNKSLKKDVRLKEKTKNNFNILSWNINGLRSNVISTKKYTKRTKYSEIEKDSNLGKLVERYKPDAICLQETRCGDVVSGCVQLSGYYQYWNSSKGEGARSGDRYSGVTLWSKEKPKNVWYEIPGLDDKEGRIILADFGDFLLLNTYTPNAGTNFEYRTNVWDPAFYKFLQKVKKNGQKLVWCGDLNVARNPIDVFWGDPNSSSYDKNALKGIGSSAKAGYTLEERRGMEKFLSAGYVDVYRELYPDEKGAYTWWNPRIPPFRILNNGWRIDYFLVSESLMKCVVDMKNIKDAGVSTKPQGSDHGAILLTLKRGC